MEAPGEDATAEEGDQDGTERSSALEETLHRPVEPAPPVGLDDETAKIDLSWAGPVDATRAGAPLAADEDHDELAEVQEAVAAEVDKFGGTPAGDERAAAETALETGGMGSPESAVPEADEEDLDEISELIAQTVSTFNDDEAPLEIGLAGDRAGDDDRRFGDSLVGERFGPGSAPGTVPPDETTQVLPQIAPTPPSIFADADQSAIAEGPPRRPRILGGLDDQRVEDPTEPGARRYSGRKRREIDVPSDILEDEVAVAKFVVSSPDVVLLVDGDSVAKLGWPSLPVAQQRDALVTYLADLSTTSGAAPDVVFDGRIGDDQSLPASRAVRIRLSTPPTEPAAALDELVDAYPEQWPIALVTDDPELAASADERGAAVLNNGQLLDLFIAE